MLQIVVPAGESYDSENNLFYSSKETKLTLEHSLVSISKWEAKWHKPFLTNEKKNHEESVDYIRCMTLTQNVDPNVYKNLPAWVFKEVSEYIEAPMTATTFSKVPGQAPSREIITSEIIYYWMIALNIPFECQKWHLARLLTLIKVCDIKNQPKKKMSKSEIMARNRQLNAARRSSMNSRG